MNNGQKPFVLDEYIVKAIPNDWIKKWLETCIPHYDYERLTYYADVYEMIEDWEKENEESN